MSTAPHVLPAPPDANLGSAGPAALAWVDAQHAEAQRRLAGLPAHTGLWRWFSRHLAAGECRSVAVGGGTIFTVERRPGADVDVVVARPPGGAPRTVLDPRAVAGPDASVLGVTPGAEGQWLAVAIGAGGDERAALHVVEPETGHVLPDAIPDTRQASVAWWPDGAGFFYTRLPRPGSVPAGEEHYGLTVWAHRLGDDPADDRPVLVPDSPLAIPHLDVSLDGHHLLVALHEPAGATELRLLDIFRQEWRTLAASSPAPVPARLAAGSLWAVLRDTGPGGRLVQWPLHDGDRRPVTVIPAGPAVLHEVVAAGGGVVVHASRGSASILLRCSPGTAPDSVPVSRGRLVALAGEPGGRVAALVAHDRLGAAPELVELCGRALRRRAWTGRPPGLAPARRRLVVDGRAGERLVTVLAHPDRDVDDRTPALLGLNPGGIAGRAVSAWHRLGLRVLLEAGSSYAMVSAPAGAPVTGDDLVRAAARLAAAGVADPRRIALEGASSGALPVGLALVQHPERFCGAVLRNPLCDLARFERLLLGRYWVGTLAAPARPGGQAEREQHSPVHQVDDLRDYPPTLFVAGRQDSRVHPSHAWKLAARLGRAAEIGGGSVPLLLSPPRAGHSSRRPRAVELEELTATWAFLFSVLGLPTEEVAP